MDSPLARSKKPPDIWTVELSEAAKRVKVFIAGVPKLMFVDGIW